MSKKTVLFSPVGTADPITALGDGPMLHIVRQYHPDEVILFLSPKMGAYEQDDHRYTRAIELLCKHKGWQMPKLHVRYSQSPVHLFDLYIKEFQDFIDAMLKEMGCKRKNVHFLANASSGTPAMEQAVVAVGAFGKYDMQVLQVSTPRKDSNRSGDRENPDKYDLDLLWECDEDNEEGAENRVIEARLVTFGEEIAKQNVMALIDQYDYAGAYELAKDSPISEQAVIQIKAAQDRLNLTRRYDDEHKQLEEYLQALEVRMKQGKWGDFVRALTPAFTWTAIFALERAGLPRTAYLVESPQGLKLDKEKISANARLSRFFGSDLSKAGAYVHNWMLDDLVDQYCQQDVCQQLHVIGVFENGKKLPNGRRERSPRNLLAHTMACAGKAELEAAGHATFDEVMSLLYQLNGCEPGEYDKLNRSIKGLL